MSEEAKRKAAMARAMLNALARWRDENATRLAFQYSPEHEMDSLDNLAKAAGGM